MQTRKDPTGTALCSLAALAGLTHSCTQQKEAQVVPAEGTRPNIIYIMSDDHAYQAISAYGDPIGKLAPTPNIDRLANEGMRFQRSFVENSISSPSRACLITGLYSSHHGQRMLDEGIDSTRTFVSELMQQAGYQTAMIGKWHLKTTPKGFDYYHTFDDQGTYWNPVFRGNTTNNEWRREEGYATRLVTQHTKEFLDNRDKSKPFFVLMHHKAPHRAWLPDTTYLGMYDQTTFALPPTFYDDYSDRGEAAHRQEMHIVKDMRLGLDLKVDTLYDDLQMDKLITDWYRMNDDQKEAYIRYYGPRREAFRAANMTPEELGVWKYQAYLRDYLATIHSVDESVGEIYDYLKANNLLDNTIIIYDSDQGFYMGEHGWFDKRFMYEVSLRTPLLIRYPKSIPAGTVNTDLVQNIDFAPTFLALAGAEQPEYMKGLPLTRVFDGQKHDDWRKSIYYHYYDYPAWHMVRRHDGVRTDRYKLIHFYRSDVEAALTPRFGIADTTVDYYELYDLQNDPDELHSIYGKPGTEEITAELMQLLQNYRKELEQDEY